MQRRNNNYNSQVSGKTKPEPNSPFLNIIKFGPTSFMREKNRERERERDCNISCLFHKLQNCERIYILCSTL